MIKFQKSLLTTGRLICGSTTREANFTIYLKNNHIYFLEPVLCIFYVPIKKQETNNSQDL